LSKKPTDFIDRDSLIPAYAQLVDILRQKVANGELLPGDRLPSEAELCEKHSVSPMTVRRAIGILVDQDVVTTEQGRGTFVKPMELGSAAFDLDALQRIFQSENTTVKLLRVGIESASQRIAEKLSIRVGERTVFIRRLIMQDEEPLLYHREYTIYDPGRPIIESEMDVTALRGLFSGGGAVILKRGDLKMDVTTLNEEEAQLLLAPVGAPAFRLEHIFYDFRNTPVSWGWFIWPGHLMHLTTTVGVQEASNYAD
jgi:GntR family transcriptional regulator